MTTSETKREIRAMMRSKRRDLSSTDRERASFDLMKRLLALPGILHARRVAAYVANDGEIDPLPALTELVMTGVHGYLPVLFNTRRPRVRFARYFPNAPLVKAGLTFKFHCMIKKIFWTLFSLIGCSCHWWRLMPMATAWAWVGDFMMHLLHRDELKRTG